MAILEQHWKEGCTLGLGGVVVGLGGGGAYVLLVVCFKSRDMKIREQPLNKLDRGKITAQGWRTKSTFRVNDESRSGNKKNLVLVNQASKTKWEGCEFAFENWHFSVVLVL